MKKIRYYITRLFQMNYVKMFKYINKIHKRSGKSRISIFFDILSCSTKYLAGYMDYFVFHFEDLKEEQRKTFITRGINNAYIQKLNNREFYEKFDNKVVFNQLFNQFLNRDYLDLNNSTLEQFKKFIERHSTFMAKPINLQCGKGIEKIKVEGNPENLRKKLIDHGQTLIEEFVIQSDEMNELFPTAVNTLRIVTARINHETTVLFRAIRIGNGNNVVDNFNHGGMYSIISEQGIINKPAIDKEGTIYEVHPITKTPIVGFKIPYFEEAIEMCKKASSIIEEVGLVGWDIAITNKGPVMIEGNQLPGYDIYQSKIHLNEGNVGMKPFFDKVIFKSGGGALDS